MKVDTVILGAGIAGLSASLFLTQRAVPHLVLERGNHSGGHAASSSLGGYVFDEGPHVLFSQDKEMLHFLGAPQPSSYVSLAKPVNAWSGRILSHPPFLSFSEINDRELSRRIASELIMTSDEGEIKTYADWVRLNQGPTASELFTAPYTRNYWRSSLSELDIDWIGKRVHAVTPDQRSALNEALKDDCLQGLDLTRGSHYLTSFTYSSDGFWSLFPNLHDLEVQYGSEVTRIDLDDRRITTSAGDSISYLRLINTMPLPDFLEFSGLNVDRSSLEATSLTLLDVVVESHSWPDPTWAYVIDGEYRFARVSYPDNYLPHSASGGHKRLQIEFYSRESSEGVPEIKTCEVLDQLKKLKLVPFDARLIDSRIRFFRYANVIPLKGRAQTVREIQDRLGPDVQLAGRFGSWSNLWTVESARSGFNAAAFLCKRNQPLD